MSNIETPTIDQETVDTSVGCFPLQALVFVFADEYDRDQLIAAYRRFDPVPEESEYPGQAYLGVPSGQVLGLPAGWERTESGCHHPNGFTVARDGDIVSVGWPDEQTTISRAWFEQKLGLSR
jgi:hypothetical protein